MSLWSSEREVAVLAAKQVANMLAERTGRISLEYKGKNDPVTQADADAQQMIRQTIRRRFPDDDFLGEEDAGAVARSSTAGKGRRWIVDPIDGTMNFARGVPLFCTSIALEVDGELVVGVVADPVRGEFFSAAKGQGATCNHTPIHVSPIAKLDLSMLTLGMPTDVAKVPGAFQVFETFGQRCSSVRRLGSTALSLAYLAAGRIDGFWSGSLYVWDSAGGIVLVQEAGGRVTNTGTATLDPFKPDLLASNGLIHATVDQSIGEVLANYRR